MLIPMSKSRFVERMVNDQRLLEREKREREKKAEVDLTDYIFERIHDHYTHRHRDLRKSQYRRKRWNGEL